MERDLAQMPFPGNLARVKKMCANIMTNPESKDSVMSLAYINGFVEGTYCDEKFREVLQKLQHYLMFPLVHHLKSTEFRNKQIQEQFVQAIDVILQNTEVTSIGGFIKYHNCLICLVFDKQQPGMVAKVSEELKKCVMEAITTLVLNLTKETRLELYRSKHTALLAQSIYVAVQIAKLEKHRQLKLAAMRCVQALTATHESLVQADYCPRSPRLRSAAADVVAAILPGVVAALQDVAVSKENQGHAVTAEAVGCIHRVLYLVMRDAALHRPTADICNQQFSQLLTARLLAAQHNAPDKGSTKPARRSPEYYQMAGEKLKLVTKSLVSLQTHEHYAVRASLAAFCKRILLECAGSMAPSLPYVLDALIALSEDEQPAVAALCRQALRAYFGEASAGGGAGGGTRARTLDCLADSLHDVLAVLPRVMNNIDTAKKISTLNLLRGYLELLANEERPQKLTRVLSCARTLSALCAALLHAVRLDSAGVSLLLQHSIPDVEAAVPVTSPWVRLAHATDDACAQHVARVCEVLAQAECAPLLVDRLLELFREGSDRAELVYLINLIVTVSPVHADLVLNTYVEPDTWHLPTEVGVEEPELTSAETLDPAVYNPRAWDKESIPGLYEGTVETRYTDVSYLTPVAGTGETATDGRCRTLREARDNVLLACLLTEGVGVVARRLGEQFQPYLLRTLCLLLERVGSRYEMLRGAGMKALADVTQAGGHADVAALVRANADYFTYQVTTRLKKSYNSVSALQILTVVMQHSDASILPCLHGIISDVLLQSCDRYHMQDVTAYLQVFLTFVQCVHRWFPEEATDSADACADTARANGHEHFSSSNEYDVLVDTLEYIRNVQEPERLMGQGDFEKAMGQTAEEMFQEDLKMKEEDEEGVDYNDAKEEKSPPPQHVAMAAVILERSVQFVTSRRPDERLLALRVLERGLPLLRRREDTLLPLCHRAWAPLASLLAERASPLDVGAAFSLLAVVAALAKDFVRSRAVKEALPSVWQFLVRSSENSLLKDAGSAYRASQAYRLQLTILDKMAALLVDLRLQDRPLEDALAAASLYLSNRQPKPLQAAAVEVFRRAARHDAGATWHRLRALGRDSRPAAPPPSPLPLHTVAGTPERATDKAYRHNILAIYAA